MTELNEIQRAIINALLFAEPFDTLVEEIPQPEPVIADELKNLIHKRLVKVMREEEGKMEASFYYDSDNIRAFWYMATSNGLKLQEESR